SLSEDIRMSKYIDENYPNILYEAIAWFGDEDMAMQWLTTPNERIENRKPIDLLPDNPYYVIELIRLSDKKDYL
ncbi:MbcA/ParS/Xre antitoxin family protein, partial [Vibrio campbellii]|uniref:MbcA/ParS/Xre antitoxin family protein n=2 Tax=Vibrio TaxID=662 RepID=UPI000680177F